MHENHYVHPSSHVIARLIESVCNCAGIKKVRRIVFNRLPFLKMRSDVKDIVYLNWLVDRTEVAKLIPNNVSVIEINGKTLISVLTYKHGKFRPSIFNVIRFAFPSPFQTNGRLYVSSLNNEATAKTVLFIKNIMSSTLYTIGTRVFSDAMQTHLANTFTHKIENNTVKTMITQGKGSSPELTCDMLIAHDFNIPIELSRYFGSDEEVIKFICFQDYALNVGSDFNGLCKAEINLPIDTS